MSTVRLTCFGVGNGQACDDRNHSAYLYTVGKTSLLLDCGEPVSRSFKASGLGCDTIDRIFISHLHSDHIGGLFMLLQGFWLDKRKKELRIHAPADGIAPLRQMLNAAYLFDEVLPFRVIFEPLRSGEPVDAGEVRVTPWRTTHLDGMRRAYEGKYPGEYAAFCFELNAAHGRSGHSADLGSPKDLDPMLEEPLDLLVCELDHLRPEELFLHLKGCEIKHLVLTHLGRRYWNKLDETRELAARALPGVRITVPRDQQVITD